MKGVIDAIKKNIVAILLVVIVIINIFDISGFSGTGERIRELQNNINNRLELLEGATQRAEKYNRELRDEIQSIAESTRTAIATARAIAGINEESAELFRQLNEGGAELDELYRRIEKYNRSGNPGDATDSQKFRTQK